MNNTTEFTEGPRVAVEVAGIIYDIQHENKNIEAKLAEGGIKIALKIPHNLDITDILEEEHDCMVMILGCVKSQQIVTKPKEVIKKWYEKWIEVDRISVTNQPDHIVNHYLNVLYTKTYLDNYPAIFQRLETKKN